jgi:hypothetical protein
LALNLSIRSPDGYGTTFDLGSMLVRRPESNAAVPPPEGHKLETTPEPSVLRIKPRKHGWVPISRALIDDSRLQFDTRAIANWLLAKPDGWQIRVGALPHLLQQRAGPEVFRDRKPWKRLDCLITPALRLPTEA